MKVLKGKQPKPRRVMLYGRHGLGKSTWAAAAQSLQFVGGGLMTIQSHTVRRDGESMAVPVAVKSDHPESAEPICGSESAVCDPLSQTQARKELHDRRTELRQKAKDEGCCGEPGEPSADGRCWHVGRCPQWEKEHAEQHENSDSTE